MSWSFLLAAIVFEVAGTTCMKLSEGFTKAPAAVRMFLLYGLSLGSLTFALKTIEVGVAYAIWSGVGTALIVLVGAVWFKEPLGGARLFWILLIIVGAVGLNLSGAAH